LPRDTPLKKTLFACDELSGFIHACGLVRPDGIDTLEPKSVRKKLKQPSFASGVNRDDVYNGAELLGVELNDHIAFVTEAMRPIARAPALPPAAASPAWPFPGGPGPSRPRRGAWHRGTARRDSRGGSRSPAGVRHRHDSCFVEPRCRPGGIGRFGPVPVPGTRT